MSGEARSHCTAATATHSGQPTLALGSLAFVQLLALGSMLIDHLGAVHLLGDWSRLVGRFALPAFVVMVAAHAWRCSRPDQVLWRLAGLFAVSQPFWWLSVGHWDQLCILVTLFAVALVITLIRRRAWDLAALALLVFLLVSPWVEYGAWPLLLVPLALASPWALLPSLLWPLVQYGQWLYALPALLAVVALAGLLRVRFNVPRLPRWVTRPFYPVHLALLAVSKIIL